MVFVRQKTEALACMGKFYIKEIFSSVLEVVNHIQQGLCLSICLRLSDEEQNQHYSLGNVLDSKLCDIFGTYASRNWKSELFNFRERKDVCSSCKDPDNPCPSSQSTRDNILKQINYRGDS